ncbi:MAG: hypothetical protein KIT14_22245 [bacterium]|nr:hypothetical protein [bacterium]
MPKKIAKKDLPSTDDVAAARSLLDAIAKRKARLEKAKEGASAGGTLDASNPKYRAARKGVKRAQRALRRELVRVHNQPKKAPAAAPEAAPPAEG